MQKSLLTALLAAFVAAQLFAQISFTNRANLLANENNSGVAMAVADMNGDGLDDIIRLDRADRLRIEFQTQPGKPFEAKEYGSLFSGDGAWGICVADADNNGVADILVGGDYTGIKFLMGKPGGGGFTEFEFQAPETFVQSVNFADIDNDGWLDGFVCHDDGPSRIFRNNGAGAFAYASAMMDLSTLPSSDGSGNYGTVWTDIDNDGDNDLYIAKCRQGVSDPTDGRRINQLFINNGDGTYTQDLTNAHGLRIGAQSWTADFGDVDNDGDMDCFITNHDLSSQLLENDGTGVFTDISVAAGLQNVINGLPIQGLFRDFDNDGWLDILVTGGDGGTSTDAFPYLFLNNGNKTFSRISGLFDANEMESCAIGDLNHDGFPDIYGGYAGIFNQPTGVDDALWMNNGNDNHFIGIGLRGKASNRSGVGARITLHTPQGIQIREIRSGESYGISNALAVQFGLRENTVIDSLSVRWPSGHVDVVYAPLADQYLTLEEGGCLVEQVNIAAAGPTTFCSGDSVKIEAPTGFAAYQWSTGDTTTSITALAAGRYQVTVTNAGGCTAVSNGVAVTVDPVEIPGIVATGDTMFCAGGSVVLTATSGTAWTWSTGATTQSIIVSNSGTYTVSAQGMCAAFSSAPVNVKSLTPELPTTTGGTTWVGGTVKLTATGGEPHWYDAPTGGNELFIGSDFTTPPLTQTTKFWAANNDIDDRPNEKTGMITHSGTNGATSFNGGIVFDSYRPFRLHKVRVYSTISAARRVVLLDKAGNELAAKTVPIAIGTPSFITLDMDIPIGNDLVLTTDESFNQTNLNSIGPQLRRADSNVEYPYEIPGVLSIKNSTAPTAPETRYYYFFDWEVDFPGLACLSARVPATAEVDPNMVGTADLAEKDLLAVVPNPAREAIWVTSTAFAGQNVALKILDARGQLLRQQAVQLPENGALRVEIADLPAGLYLLEIADGQRFARGKVVKN